MKLYKLHRSRSLLSKKFDIDLWNFCKLNPFKYTKFLFFKFKKRYFFKEYNPYNYITVFQKAEAKLKVVFRRKQSYFANLIILKKRLRFFFGIATVKALNVFFLEANYFMKKIGGSGIDFGLINYFESRLDIFIWRIRYVFSIRDSKDVISKGYIAVNNCVLLNNFTVLYLGDIISIFSRYYYYKIFNRFYSFFFDKYVLKGKLYYKYIYLKFYKLFLYKFYVLQHLRKSGKLYSLILLQSFYRRKKLGQVDNLMKSFWNKNIFSILLKSLGHLNKLQFRFSNYLFFYFQSLNSNVMSKLFDSGNFYYMKWFYNLSGGRGLFLKVNSLFLQGFKKKILPNFVIFKVFSVFKGLFWVGLHFYSYFLLLLFLNFYYRFYCVKIESIRLFLVLRLFPVYLNILPFWNSYYYKLYYIFYLFFVFSLNYRIWFEYFYLIIYNFFIFKVASEHVVFMMLVEKKLFFSEKVSFGFFDYFKSKYFNQFKGCVNLLNILKKSINVSNFIDYYFFVVRIKNLIKTYGIIERKVSNVFNFFFIWNNLFKFLISVLFKNFRYKNKPGSKEEDDLLFLKVFLRLNNLYLNLKSFSIINLPFYMRIRFARFFDFIISDFLVQKRRLKVNFFKNPYYKNIIFSKYIFQKSRRFRFLKEAINNLKYLKFGGIFSLKIFSLNLLKFFKKKKLFFRRGFNFINSWFCYLERFFFLSVDKLLKSILKSNYLYYNYLYKFKFLQMRPYNIYTFYRFVFKQLKFTKSKKWLRFRSKRSRKVNFRGNVMEGYVRFNHNSIRYIESLNFYFVHGYFLIKYIFRSFQIGVFLELLKRQRLENYYKEQNKIIIKNFSRIFSKISYILLMLHGVRDCFNFMYLKQLHYKRLITIGSVLFVMMFFNVRQEKYNVFFKGTGIYCIQERIYTPIMQSQIYYVAYKLNQKREKKEIG